MSKTQSIQVCVLLSPDGEVVRNVPPQFSLENLYIEAAHYACGTGIPPGYASQAVMEKMYKEGYAVKWFDLSSCKND